MQTCATCRYFVTIPGKMATTREGESVQVGDCRRYPPRHVMNIVTASEKDKTDEDNTIETPRTAKQYASPFYWLLVPEYASAYQGTNESLWCGEHLEKKNASAEHDGTVDPSSERQHH